MENYGIERFLKAQENDYQTALSEVKKGFKKSHWMWFIFPQIIGLGQSRNAILYSIKNIEEAKEYMANDVLSSRMNEICATLLELDTDDAVNIFGDVDAMKLHSSMTLFAEACPDNDIFMKVIEKYFSGKKDRRTIELIGWKSYVDSTL